MPEGLVLDSSILVDVRRNHTAATPYVVGLAVRKTAVVHPLCAAEVLHGAKDRKDLASISAFLGVQENAGQARRLRAVPSTDRAVPIIARNRLG
jgi:hypothetical protein